MMNSIAYFITGLLLFGLTAMVPASVEVDEHNGTLTGTVVEAQAETPVPNATVSIDGEGVSTETDANGYFELNELAKGTYTLVVEADGFPSIEREVELDGDHKEITVELESGM